MFLLPGDWEPSQDSDPNQGLITMLQFPLKRKNAKCWNNNHQYLNPSQDTFLFRTVYTWASAIISPFLCVHYGLILILSEQNQNMVEKAPVNQFTTHKNISKNTIIIIVIIAFDEVERFDVVERVRRSGTRSTKWNASLILACDSAELIALCKVIFWKTHIPVRTPKWPPRLIFAGACHSIVNLKLW